MASSHLYNLQELMTMGVLDSNGNHQLITKLEVPRIQRSYAQGRKSEYDIRESFLKELFKSLNDGVPMEMNFVYGSFDNGVFEILDGQQRLTTLFLLHWYILTLEGQNIDWLKSFAYQTRKTSTDFIQKLVTDSFDFANKPSKTIGAKKWFVLSFRQDSTVMSMINMLDAIHEKYNDSSKNLSISLDKLQFYLIPLDQYGLTEDLYIKMNARGLSLTPFDNFKADLVNHLRNDSAYKNEVILPSSLTGRKVPYDLYFSISLDNNWIDLFWKLDNKLYDKLFFRFFYRYMASKYITDIASSFNFDTMKKDQGYLFFSDISENHQVKYKGFDFYNKYLNTTYIHNIDNILNILKVHYKDEIEPCLISPWDDNAKMFDEKFNRKAQIIFTCVIEYLERTNLTLFDINDFRRWLRVAWNIVENSNIDGLEPQMNVMRRIVDILNNITVGDIYNGLAVYNGSNMSAAVIEEVEKAKLILRPSTNWEATLISAEKNKFLKGMVSFFCDYKNPSLTEQEFVARYDLVSQMFDEDGITKYFREDRILIRAILSCMRVWDGKENGLRDLHFTERVEAGTFLKNILRQKTSVWKMFDLVLRDSLSTSITDVKDRLSKVIAEAHSEESLLSAKGNSNRPGLAQFEMAYYKLVNNINLHNWIREEERNHGTPMKFFRIYYSYKHIWAAIPNAQWARVMLDTNRDDQILMLCRRLGFDYDDPNFRYVYNKFGFNFGFDVRLKKICDDLEMLVEFKWNDSLIVGLKFNDAVHFASLSAIFNTTEKWNETYMVVDSFDYANMHWYDIVDRIKDIESKIMIEPQE